MSNVLYIQASPRIERSHSIAVADAFVDAYRQRCPDDEVTKINLFEYDLIPFDGLAVQAKYTILHGRSPADEEKAAWRNVEQVIEQFLSADKYAMAVPMWNFSVPYRLKQYIDVLVQPGYTFEVLEDGSYRGLVTDRPAFIAYARGGQYADAPEFDYQTRYLQTILGFIGFTDFRTVIVEPTVAMGPELARARRATAIAEARQMAGEF